MWIFSLGEKPLESIASGDSYYDFAIAWRMTMPDRRIPILDDDASGDQAIQVDGGKLRF
jgi:hypothetical protein